MTLLVSPPLVCCFKECSGEVSLPLSGIPTASMPAPHHGGPEHWDRCNLPEDLQFGDCSLLEFAKDRCVWCMWEPNMGTGKIVFPQVAIWVLKFSFPGTSLTFAEVVVMPWVRPLGELFGACLGALTNDRGIQGTVYKGAIQRQHETQHNQVGPLTLWFDSLSLGNASSLSWWIQDRFDHNDPDKLL